MSNDKYCMSFTTGGLFHHESVNLAVLYLEIKDWNAVRQKVMAENLLQARTLSTLKRVCREVISRLKTLNAGELDLLVASNPREQNYLLWLAVCRRYRFIADFAVEVMRERYITLKTDLTHADFDAFFNRKSEWNAELDQLRSTTRNKLRQVLFKMLREADLLTANNMIKAAMLSPGLVEVISRGNRQDFFFFPAFECGLCLEQKEENGRMKTDIATMPLADRFEHLFSVISGPRFRPEARSRKRSAVLYLSLQTRRSGCNGAKPARFDQPLGKSRCSNSGDQPVRSFHKNPAGPRYLGTDS